MAVNYLGYADKLSQMNPLGNVLDNLATQKEQQRVIDRQSMLDAATAETQGLQNQASRMTLADLGAKQGAKQTLYGAATPQDAYLAEMKATKSAEEKKRRTEQTTAYLNNLDKYKKNGATPEFLKEFTKVEMSSQPEYKDLAQYIDYVDDTKMEFTKPFAEGELQDPINPGKFLPAGTYKTVFTRTNDPEKPFNFTKVEPVKAEKDKPLGNVVQDKASPTGWSYLTEQGNMMQGAPDPARGKQGTSGDGTDKIVAREAIKDLPKLRKDANMANASKSRLDQMITVFDRGSAGGLKGNVLQAISGVFDTPATSEAELFKKLASAGAGQLRSTVIGPGQVSNYEQKLLQSVSGGGSGARTAIRELLLFYKQEADRTIGN